MSDPASGFVPPPYPFDRLDELAAVAAGMPGGIVDLSVGTPSDPPPEAVVAALGSSGAERGYPASIGSRAYRSAAAGWLARRLGVQVDPDAELAACVGTKELVAGLPGWLALRRPERDTVLFPAISYPTYAMGATLARLRAVPYTSLDDIDPADAARALCLWVNSPSNPTGALDDLGAAAEWGRRHDVTVASDECYVEFTWSGPGATILEHGTAGVLAVHSLSKRSNLAGARAGFYAGDAELVRYLSEIRKHAGFMVPGPVQAAAVVAWDDDDHVEAQRARYRDRLARGVRLLAALDVPAAMPDGGFYLWAPAPAEDAWALTRLLAERAGVLVAPGEFYGPGGAGHVRAAMVCPDATLALAEHRLGVGERQ